MDSTLKADFQILDLHKSDESNHDVHVHVTINCALWFRENSKRLLNLFQIYKHAKLCSTFAVEPIHSQIREKEREGEGRGSACNKSCLFCTFTHFICITGLT